MKCSIFVIFGFCVAKICCNIAYKAKFIGNVKVAGESQSQYALSVTHCLALCNKETSCDAITFQDVSKKCRLFKRCTPMKMQNKSSHYWFFSKRPPISKKGYVYEEFSDSCIKLMNTPVEYNRSEHDCDRDHAYLVSPNSPQIVSLASLLLSEREEEEAWVSEPSNLEKFSKNRKNALHSKKSHKRFEIGMNQPVPSTCWVLQSVNNRVTEVTECESAKKLSICQIPTY